MMGSVEVTIEKLAIPDVILIDPVVYGDARGFFLETWSAVQFEALGVEAGFVQDNWSRSSRGVLRGLHYQLEHPQGKLVRCTRGSIFDVAVDLRRSSPTFGSWVGAVLSEENKHSLWIPPYFAHGFLSLDDVVDVHYKCSDIYHPLGERTIQWDDPDIGIDWPVERGVDIRLSDKDQNGSRPISDSECFD